MIKMLKKLASEGCQPAISRRGKVWRAHVDAAGNFWAEDKCPQIALNKAVAMWRSKGSPKDGMAA